MRDDGTGINIMIPAVLISQEDGKILKEYYQENKENQEKLKIHVSIDFEMSVKNKTTIDIFYSSEHFNVYNLLKEFVNYQDKFDHKDLIFPHLVSFQNYYYKQGENKDYANCVCFGKFCAVPILDKGITGEDIIVENIRQMCVFQFNSDYYWKYVIKFHDWCGNYDFSQKCAEKIIKSLEDGEDFSKNVTDCIKNSFKGILFKIKIFRQ